MAHPSSKFVGSGPHVSCFSTDEVLANLLHQISYDELELHPDLLYEEEAVQIFDLCSKAHHWKERPLVKVSWSRHGIEEVIWVREAK